MNKTNQNKLAPLLSGMFILLGMFIGMFFSLAFFPDDWKFIAINLGILGFCLLISFAVFILRNFTIPYINRRRAAIRALGRDGIRIMRHDETARLAYKGIYALFKGNYPDAEDKLMEALAGSEVRQNQRFCTEWLIKLYETTENYPKLLWCYKKAVEYAPENTEAQSRLGHAYLSDGQLEKAEYCFEQAVRYDPNNGYSYFSLVKIYLVRGEDERAHETLEKLMKINGNHPLAHSEYANYYALMGNREKAEEECKKALLCGFKDPEEINRRINAMLSFSDTEYSASDLPQLYYRKIEKRKAKE